MEASLKNMLFGARSYVSPSDAGIVEDVGISEARVCDLH